MSKLNIRMSGPQLIFAYESRICVLSVVDLLDIGTPIDPDTDEDMEFLGYTNDNIDPGLYEQSEFEVIVVTA